jgi:hypothetical protein
MFEMVRDSAKNFFLGKLFQDNAAAWRQLAIGAGIGALATVIVGLAAPAWLAAIVGGGIAGFAQPILFKDIKYA